MAIIADAFPKFRNPKSEVKQMSKKFRFRGPFNNQHDKRVQALFKSAKHHLYHIYW